MVIYFTGTGNSRFAARIIAEELNDELLSINDCFLKESCKTIISEKPLVFVCPIHTGRIPSVVENFILQNDFVGSTRTYFVTTCGGDPFNAERYVIRLCSKKGLTYAGFYAQTMPTGNIIMFYPPDKCEERKILDDAETQIRYIAAKINAGHSFMTRRSKGKLMSLLVHPIFFKFMVKPNGFFTTDNCVGCGKCSLLCTMNNITIKGGKPQWGKNCIFCLACINACPNQAIEYKNRTQGKNRHYIE